jgi:hypothetical protein
MNRLIHYTDIDYIDGFFGGVPRFDFELHRALPEIETISKKRHGAQALLSLTSDDLVITGNDLCIDVPKHVKCIAVHHGIARTHKDNDPAWAGDHYVARQDMMVNRPNTYFIGCSEFCRTEFKKHYGVDDHSVILHAVQVKPLELPKQRTRKVIGDWRSHTKSGGGVIELLRDYSKYEFLQLKCGRHDKEKAAAYFEAAIYFTPTLHEGNSYSMLDGIACGLPVVATDVGLFGGNYDPRVGECFPFTEVNNLQLIEDLLDKVYDNYDDYSPIGWMEEVCSFDWWTYTWRKTILEIRDL